MKNELKIKERSTNKQQNIKPIYHIDIQSNKIKERN